jgi:hypothetical protein
VKLDIIVSSVQEFLIRNIPEVVVKFSRDAKRQETLESRRAADIYIAARTNMDSWVTYSSFNEEIIRKAASLIPTSFSDYEIKLYSHDKNRIPYKYREYFVKAAHDWHIQNYVELNEYYRIISGQPPLGAEFLYLDDEVYEKYETGRAPVHLIPQLIANMMDADDVFQDLHKQYPQYDYLRHVGLRRVDILKARNADNFDILYIPKRVENYAFHRDFVRCYDQSKEYILSVVYNIYYSSKYDYYDNYLAFLVLMMAVQQLISNVFKILVNRDFYDTNTIRLFLESYGIPYSGSFSVNQNRLLVKNLNVLLSKKSNSKVLIDIMDLLGFNDFELVKYYLVKHHKVDGAGNPIFKYLKDADGNYILDENGEKILDAEEVYEFYFNAIPIDAEDVQNELFSSNNVLTYEEMISKDPLWIDDSTTKQLMMQTEFNYLQTKYIDVNAVFRLQEILFETVYLTRIILDKRETETKSILVTLNLLTESAISLFDCFILLICLMCKSLDIEPDLLSSPSKIMYILGFNFKADFETIRQDILNNRLPKRDGSPGDVVIPNLYRSELANYIMNTKLDKIKAVNDMYVVVRDLEDLLVQGMQNAKSIEAYEAYKTLYKTLLFTELNNSIYNLNDGSTPEKFSDYLRESNLDLYSVYRTIPKEQAAEYIEYITQRLMVMLPDIQHLDAVQLLSVADVDSLIKLLRFFQSYTVDIRTSKIVLLLDSKFDNMIHMTDYFKRVISKVKVNEEYDAIDLIRKINEQIMIKGIGHVDIMMRQMLAHLRNFEECEFEEVVNMILTGRVDERVDKIERAAIVANIMFDLTGMDIWDRIIKAYTLLLMSDNRKYRDSFTYSASRIFRTKISSDNKLYVDMDIEMDDIDRVVRDTLYELSYTLINDNNRRVSDSYLNNSRIELDDDAQVIDTALNTDSIIMRDNRRFAETVTFIWDD